MPAVLALLAGLVSACAFEPIGAWPLMPLAFVALLRLVARARSLRGALALGWVFGWGQFVLGLNWIATAFTYQAVMPHWLGWLAVALLSVYLAVYPAAAAGLAWRYGREEPGRLVLLLAAAWVVTEWLRATMFTGFAWNPVGVALLEAPGIAGWARLIGTYGLSGLTVLIGGMIWLLLRSLREGLIATGWPMLERLATIGALAATGALLLPTAPPPHADRVVHIVQPDIGQQDKHDPGFRGETWARLTSLTGPPGQRRLVLWPEAASTLR